jgi:hypothetical protein
LVGVFEIPTLLYALLLLFLRYKEDLTPLYLGFMIDVGMYGVEHGAVQWGGATLPL